MTFQPCLHNRDSDKINQFNIIVNIFSILSNNHLSWGSAVLSLPRILVLSFKTTLNSYAFIYNCFSFNFRDQSQVPDRRFTIINRICLNRIFQIWIEEMWASFYYIIPMKYITIWWEWCCYLVCRPLEYSFLVIIFEES